MPTSEATKKPAARSGTAASATPKPAARKAVQNAKQAAAKQAAAKAAPKTAPKTAPVAASNAAPMAESAGAASAAVATALPVANGALRLKGLIERVAKVTGGKKKAVKEIVEATLTELSAALEKGEPINLPGLGRIRVKAAKDGATPAAMTLKRRAATKGEGKKKVEKEPLAEGGEAG